MLLEVDVLLDHFW